MSSIVQIKDSAYDGLQSLRVHGETRQNLWTNPSGTASGVTVTANENGTISISGDFDGTTVNVSSDYIYVLKPSTQYAFSIDKSVINAGGGYFALQQFDADGTAISGSSKYVGYGNTLSITFTTDASMSKCICVFYANSNAVITNGTYRVMLNEGSTAEPWCPPGLNSVGEDGSVDIVTAGKNLFNASSKYNRPALSIGADGVITLGNGFTWVSFDAQIVNIPKGTKITLSKSVALGGACGPGVWLYHDTDSDNRAELTVYGSTNEHTYTATRDYNRIRCFINGGFVTANTPFYVQLELGSTATDYEPPSITTTAIDLQGHTLNALPDGTRDELHIDGGGNVVLEKRCGVDVAPTSAGEWGWQAEYGRGLFGISPKAISVAGIGTLLCDKLPPREAKADVREGTYSLASTASAYARVSTIDSLSKLVPIAGGAKYIYRLAKPQTIDLGTIELPKLRKKPLVNTILANGTAEGTGFSLAPEIDCEYNRWSTYCDGFKTHGKHSYFDMGCCLAARDTGTPEKKNITATVPYMSGFYDFSKLYGAIAFEARQLTYRFEFVEDSREELQQKKSQFLEWLSQVHDEEIADDDIPGRHFIGSLSEWEFEEGEEGQSGSLEVTFNCQPFLEADEDTTKTCSAGSNTVTVEGQPVNAYAKTSSGTATIQIGGVTQSVGTTEIRLSVQLQPGDNAVTVTGSAVTLRWRELTA